MKKLLAVILFTFSIATSAQNSGGMQMNQAQMQQMMQQAREMQNCMANIDQAELQAFQQKAEQMQAEVKALCSAGKRDAAMTKAMAFGKESMSSKVMQDMKKCGEGMKNMMPNLPAIAQSDDDGSEPRHICDQ